jgi:hypothetical protein
MEAMVERSNMKAAYERVVGNEGKPGIDGMSVAELKPYLQTHWERIKGELLEGRYEPQPVRAWHSANNGRGAWWNSGAPHMHAAYKRSDFSRMGLVSLLNKHLGARNLSQTAG